MKHTSFLLAICFSLTLSTKLKAQDTSELTHTINPDSYSHRNMFKLDLLNILDNNPAILFSFEHRLGHKFRILHEIGPTVAIDNYVDSPDNIALNKIGFGLWGFKSREEIRFLVNPTNKSIFYIGAGLQYHLNKINNINYAVAIEDGNSFYYRAYDSDYTREKAVIHLSFGIYDTSFSFSKKNQNMVFDFGCTIGAQKLDHQTRDIQTGQILKGWEGEPFSGYEEDGFLPSFRLYLQLGFVPKSIATRLGTDWDTASKMSRAERKEALKKVREERKLAKESN